MNTSKENESHLLSSVKNALRILRSFSIDEPEKRVSDLAAELNLSKSTVSRLLATLASEDFVTKDSETNRYKLGVSVLALSGVVTQNLEIYREAQPILNDLVDKLGETAHLAVLDGMETLYIHQVECKYPVRILTHLGKRNPVHCTSSGKVLLAYQDEAFIQKVIERGLEPLTKHTITDPDVLKKQLETIKEQGFSHSKHELLQGVVSIAAPIRDYTEKVVAALTVVGPEQRIPNYKIRPYAKQVMNASMEISDRLGYWR